MRRFRNVMTRDSRAAFERADPRRAFFGVSDGEGFLSLQTGRAERQWLNEDSEGRWLDMNGNADIYEFVFMFVDASWRSPA